MMIKWDSLNICSPITTWLKVTTEGLSLSFFVLFNDASDRSQKGHSVSYTTVILTSSLPVYYRQLKYSVIVH